MYHADLIDNGIVWPTTAQNKSGWDVQVFLKAVGRHVRVDVKTYDICLQKIIDENYFDEYKEQLCSLELANEDRSCGFAKTGADYVAFQTGIFNPWLLAIDDNVQHNLKHYFDQAANNVAWYEKTYDKRAYVVSLFERPFLTWFCASEAYKEQTDDFPMHVRTNKPVPGENSGKVLYVSLSNLRAMEQLWIDAGRPSKRINGGLSLKELNAP